MSDLRFSQRHGYSPVRQSLQYESMDRPLRNRLWNIVYHQAIDFRFGQENASTPYVKHWWCAFLKATADTVPRTPTKAMQSLKEYFFETDRFRPYDVLEHVDGWFHSTRTGHAQGGL